MHLLIFASEITSEETEGWASDSGTYLGVQLPDIMAMSSKYLKTICSAMVQVMILTENTRPPPWGVGRTGVGTSRIFCFLYYPRAVSDCKSMSLDTLVSDNYSLSLLCNSIESWLVSRLYASLHFILVYKWALHFFQIFQLCVRCSLCFLHLVIWTCVLKMFLCTCHSW